MKTKILPILLAFVFFFSLASVNAQETTTNAEAKPVFERYSFFSQWQLTLNGGLVSNMGNLSSGFDPSYGFGLVLAKPLNHIWQVRLQYMYGNLNGSEVNYFDLVDGLGNPRKGKLTGSVNEANLNFTFSLTDLFGGYNPKRFLGVYLLAGGGFNFVSGQFEDAKGGEDIYEIANEKDKSLQIEPLFTTGLGLRFRLAESWALNLESAFKFMPNCFNDNYEFNQPGMYNYTSLGITYDLGICKSVKARIEAEKQLAAEQAAADAERLQREKEECDKAKENEKKLKERISSLEKEMNDKVNSQLSESQKKQKTLQEQMDFIKKNQSTYFALPFSILFGVEQHSVPASQQQVLKAIAKVIKDDANANYKVIGFADYSGSDAYNDKLSQKRAEAVKNALVKKYGVPEGRLSVDSKGKKEAFGDIKFSVNRRVSFIRVIE